MAKVAVIGAGIIGLSTAYNLKKSSKTCGVKIIAKALTPETCSDVAAGLWEPFLLRDTPKELQRKWSKATWDLAEELIKNDDAANIGVSYLPAYNLYDTIVDKLPDWHSLVPTIRLLTKKDLENFPEKYKSGFFFKTYVIEGSKYMPWLMKRFLEIGGAIEMKEVKSFDELADNYDVVINCTGFGARKLCSDTSIEPVRGQVMRVKAPWLKTIYLCDLSNQRKSSVAYIIPNIGYVVLGGTAQAGNFSEAVDASDKAHILRETRLIEPSLSNAVHLKDTVGLRPSRPSVRLEIENMVLSGGRSKKKILKVVHNYGHGGAGVTVHWGCAIDAVKLAMKCIEELQQDGLQLKAKL